MNNFDLPKAPISGEELSHWEAIANELETINAKEKIPHRVVTKIIKSLRLGYVDSARNICWQEIDKFMDAKDIAIFLREKLFADQKEKPWSYLENKLS